MSLVLYVCSWNWEELKIVDKEFSLYIKKTPAFFNISISDKWKWISLFLFNRHLNRGCLVYMFSLLFSGSKFLLNLWRQFRVRKIFRTQVFAEFSVFSFYIWNYYFENVLTYVLGRSFTKTCSLTSCWQAFLFISMEYYLIGQKF